MKKLIKGFFALLLCVSFLSVNVLGAGQYISVKYNKSIDRSNTLSSGAKLRVFYDYGTNIPGDNANIFGTSRYNKRNYVGYTAADYGTKNFNTDRDTTYGQSEARIGYNPYLKGVNYLEPGSFVQSEGDINSGFLMNLKVTK